MIPLPAEDFLYPLKFNTSFNLFLKIFHKEHPFINQIRVFVNYLLKTDGPSTPVAKYTCYHENNIIK